MDTVIKVKCIDQALTLINSPVIASGGLNENKLECEFCEKWDGFSKTAVFYQDKKNVYYSVLDENDTCIIPKEATASKGTMCFGIFGSKGDVTRTSEVLRYKIDEGAITDDLKPSDPTPDIYEQLLAKLQEIREAEATFETNITNQQNTFESKITEQQNNYEASLTKKENDYESDLTNQWSTYKSDLTKQQNTFEDKITEQQTDISNQWATYKTDLTKQQEDYETNLNGQMTTFRSETEAEITEKLSKVYRPCGSVANYDALPKNAEVGDVYNLLDTGVNYAWTGTEWDSLAGIVDLSDYYTKSEADTLLDKKINVADSDVVARHRIPRGKDITEYYQDGTLWTRIANNFDDIYVGDYFKMSRAISAYERTGSYQTTGSQYVTIAELNPEYYNGDSYSLNYNHIGLIPGQFKSGSFHFGKSRMNSSNTTEGGYIGSEMYTTTLGAVATSGSTSATASINQQLYAEFGSHLKTYSALLTNSINPSGYNRFSANSGCSNNWAWVDVQSILLSEIEVYGSIVWSSSGYDVGANKAQWSLFRLCPECIGNRSSYYWLKDITSSQGFARVDHSSAAHYYSAGDAGVYVRPRFILA